MKPRNLVLRNGWIVEEVEPGRWLVADPMTGAELGLTDAEQIILVAAWKAGGQEVVDLVEPQVKMAYRQLEEAHEEHAKALQRAYRRGALVSAAAGLLGVLLSPVVRYLMA